MKPQQLPYLNFGCGGVYHPSWINADLHSNKKNILKVDLRLRLPFVNASFAVCYSTHVIEHLTKKECSRLFAECKRILKPGGVLRVVVPDLLDIVRKYLAVHDLTDEEGKLKREWFTIELIDQLTREWPGGEMAPFLLANQKKDFVKERIGLQEGNIKCIPKPYQPFCWKRQPLLAIWFFLLRLIVSKRIYGDITSGFFRAFSGEVHKWLYDYRSLEQELLDRGFCNIKQLDAFQSEIPGFSEYQLDIDCQGRERRPNSLYVEAVVGNT